MAVLLIGQAFPPLTAVADDHVPAPAKPSVDGKIVFQSDATGDHDVWIMDGDGSDQRKLTTESANLEEEDGEPSFATDARRIVFASCRDGGTLPCFLGDLSRAVGNADIFSMLPDGTSQKKLTSNLSHDASPEVSPDGRQVVFVSYRDIGRAHVFVMNADGSGQRALTTGLHDNYSPTWSPDGRRIAFVSTRDGNAEIYIMNADGTQPQRQTSHLSDDLDPAWSPDGTEIAWASARTGNLEIFVRAVSGTAAPTRLTNHAAADRAPTFSPRATEIAFSSLRDGDAEIFIMNADGTSPRQVTDNTASDLVPDWIENVSLTAPSTVDASPASIPVGRIPLTLGAPNSSGDDLKQDPGVGGDSMKLEDIGLGGDSMKLEDIGLGGDSLKLEDIGLGGDSLKLEDIGLGGDSLKLEDIGLGTLEGLKSIPLSALGIVNAPPTWAEIFVGTPFEGRSEHTVSLGDLVLATDTVAPTVHDLRLDQLDLRQAPFGSLRFDALLLGRTRFRDIPTPFDGDWCGRFEVLGSASCGAEFGGLDGTPLRAQIAGLSFDDPVHPIALHTVEPSKIALDPEAPVKSLLLRALDLGVTEIGAVTPGDLLTPSDAFDCVRVDCSATSTTTLLEASNLVPSGLAADATIGDLGPATGTAVLGELVFAVARYYPIEAIPYDRLGIRGWRGTRSDSVTYSLVYAPVGVPAADRPAVTLTLPSGFFYDSARLSGRTTDGDAIAETAVEPASVTETPDSTVLTFNLDRIVEAGANATLAVTMRPGTILGTRAASVSVAAAGVDEVRADRAHVTVVDPFEDETPSIEANVLYSSFTLQGDSDVFRITPPADGTLMTFLLGNDDIDRDLAVFAPPTAPAVRPLRDPDGAEALNVVADEGVGFENDRTPVQPESIEVPLQPGHTLAGLAQSRGIGDESLTVRSAGGTDPYLVQVSAFNNAGSSRPYTLRVRFTPRRSLGACPATQFQFDADPYGGADEAAAILPVPTTLPSGTKTLIVFPHGRWSDTFGPASAATTLSKLNELASHAKVSGVVVPIDGDAAVRAAYQAWDASPCEVEFGNDVVRAANRAIDVLLDGGGAGVQNIVLVGDHVMTPFGALIDLTEWGNESAYVQSMPYATPNALSAASAGGYVLSDDPWADLAPTAVPGGWLYLADLAAGRLVEGPADVAAAVDAFISSNGILQPDSAVSAATDFMKDVGEHVRLTTESLFGASETKSLIGDGWTFTELRDAILGASRPDVVSLQAHADAYRLLPPAEPARPFTTADLDADIGIIGRIWFTMGCHTGENRPDRLGGGGAPYRDWTQALAQRSSVVVAQTGYGLGGRHTFDLSEPVVGGFGDLLLRTDSSGRTSLTAGQALAVSKRRQLTGDGVPGVYLKKALEEATLFGLPMYQSGAASTPAPSVAQGFGALEPSNRTPVTDPETGVAYSDVDVQPQYETVITPDGRFLVADGETPQVTHNRPVVPKRSIRVTSKAARARGVTIESLATADQTGFDPVVSRPLLAGGAINPPASERSDVRFPAVPARVTSSGDEDTLVALVGAFAGRDLADGRVTGRHRRVTSARYRVWYSTSDDITPPSARHFDVSTAVVDGAHIATITARVDDDEGPENVAAVSVLALDSSGSWKLVKLDRDTGNPELFTKTFPFTGPGIEVVGQILDRNGNTKFLTNKGLDFAGTDLPDGTLPRYAFDGPYSPYLGKTVTAGQTVPIRFRLSLNGVPVVDPSAVAGVASYRVDCTTLQPPPGTEATQVPLSALTVEDQTYHLNWKTPTGYAGKCAVLEIALDDETTHGAFFRFKN